MADPSRPFEVPSVGWFLAIDGGLGALALLAYDERAYGAARDVMPLPEQATLRTVWWGAVGLHVGEALLARSMARRRSVRAAPWIAQTFVVGFPSLLKLRKIG